MDGFEVYIRDVGRDQSVATLDLRGVYRLRPHPRLLDGQHAAAPAAPAALLVPLAGVRLLRAAAPAAYCLALIGADPRSAAGQRRLGAGGRAARPSRCRA